MPDSSDPLDAEFFPEKPLWTPEINRQILLVLEWLACDFAGAHFWGTQRVGKSEFAKYLAYVVRGLSKGAATTVVWSFLGCKPKTAEDLLRKCLLDTGITAIASRDYAVLRLRLVMGIVAKCSDTRAKQVILVVDELQNVPPSLYGVLMGITSDLITKGLRPLLLTIGQPEMRHTVESLLENRELQTIGRLFPTCEEYRGLSQEGVKELLENMDGEGHQFTSRHFPTRAAEGWIIADLCMPLNQAMDELYLQKNLTALPRLPLGYLRPALNRMFHYLANEPLAVVDKDYAFECFRFCGFHKVAEYYVEQLSI